MAEKNFAITPSVSISRSKFLRTSTHKTSFNLGAIVPLYVDEVLPGDTRSIDVASLIRMSTPIAPIMDDIEMELFAFFVPNRIVWTNWKKFMGESPTAGYQAWNGTYPYVALEDYETYMTAGMEHVIGKYMGLGQSTAAGGTRVSALPLRGYLAIYNRWFRDQNVEAPATISLGDGQDSSSVGGSSYTYGSNPLVAYKKSDYFTRALPYAQKSAPVTLPLGTTAPVGFYATGNVAPGSQEVTNKTGASAAGKFDTLEVFTTGGSTSNGDVVADLRNATAATINQLREAFQLQKLLEKDALYGTRYWELLYGHFGVRSPDATLQDPEYLGGIKFMINIDQVLQTGVAADWSSDEYTGGLGRPGANSVTGNNGSLFTKSFVEHGHIFILGVARQSRHTYGQGIMPMWQRFDRYDYYWPEFANLGAQEIKKKALFLSGTSATDEATFGYQEAWADYRYKPSIVSGVLAPWQSGALDFWTLADKFNSTPTLSTSFLKETRSNLSRCLSTGSTGPDFIADFYFKDTAVRPLPLYSIPGLIDHH